VNAAIRQRLGVGPTVSKLAQGDRQAPEGCWMVARSQLNPNSRWRRSFDLGYPTVIAQGCPAEPSRS